MAKVGFAIAIATEQGHTVSGQVIESIGDFSKAGFRVEEGGQGGEKAIGSGIFLLERCAVLVTVAG